MEAIVEAAHDLTAKRDTWLNPPDAKPETLSKPTPTNLSNERHSWPVELHPKLDEAVLRCMGGLHR